MIAGVMAISGLTDGAVLSVVAATSAVTLILIHAIPDTDAPVLARYIAAWIH